MSGNLPDPCGQNRCRHGEGTGRFVTGSAGNDRDLGHHCDHDVERHDRGYHRADTTAQHAVHRFVGMPVAPIADDVRRDADRAHDPEREVGVPCPRRIGEPAPFLDQHQPRQGSDHGHRPGDRQAQDAHVPASPDPEFLGLGRAYAQ